jgi:hypothetical protein
MKKEKLCVLFWIVCAIFYSCNKEDLKSEDLSQQSESLIEIQGNNEQVFLSFGRRSYWECFKSIEKYESFKKFRIRNS